MCIMLRMPMLNFVMAILILHDCSNIIIIINQIEQLIYKIETPFKSSFKVLIVNFNMYDTNF